ncbi:MAG: ribosome assembly cofactor RimP [Bacteroidia bacterium]
MIEKQTIIKLAQERIDELNNGTFLVDINVVSGNKIMVEIDNLNGGVSISDCVSVSRNIEHNLDRETQDFELEVSSPGLNKPFKVMQQYHKNIGKNVKVALTPIGSKEGKLVSVTTEKIELESTEKVRVEGKKKKELITTTTEIPFNQIKETKIILSF